MESIAHGEVIATGSDGAGGAVGVPESHWFVAVVKNNTEKTVARRLEEQGVQSYLPVQKDYRVWKNGRRAIIERSVIPGIVFVRCTEGARRKIVNLPYILRFMMDKAAGGSDNARRLAIIPERQIKTLQFMLGNSDTPVTIASRPPMKGDKVRVIRGKLKGLEGEVMDFNKDKTELVVGLEFFGCAKLMTDTMNVEVIDG